MSFDFFVNLLYISSSAEDYGTMKKSFQLDIP